MRPHKILRGIDRQHRLKVSAHDDLADLTAVLPRRHRVLEITRSRTPDITGAFTDLFEAFGTRHLWLELIKNRFVFPDNHLWQRRRIARRSSPGKLSWDQMI